MRIKYAIAASAIALLCAPVLAACGSDDDGGSPGASTASAASKSGGIDKDKPPVRFAFVSLKIPGSDILGTFGAGVDAAVKKINATGGFGGREVVVEHCNSMGSPVGATTCARKTLDDDPVAEFGCEIRWATTGLQHYSRAKIPSFNCPTSTEDFTNPWNFSVAAGGVGENRGLARWLCTRSDVKKVTFFTIDLPQLKEAAGAGAPVLKGCGKQLTIAGFPENAADLTTYVNKVTQSKPDFVAVFPLSGAQGIQIFKAFQQSGFPATKMGAVSSEFDYVNTLKPAGAAMDGMYGVLEYANWGDTSNPDVAAYLEAMKGSPHDPRSTNPQQGYAMVMWFYTVAKQIGFDKFDSASLAQFMRTQKSVHIPLSNELVNPGPKGFPQVKQPQVQIVQWKDGKLTTITEGTENGWINAL